MKIGDKVICINNKKTKAPIKQGEVYTIIEIRNKSLFLEGLNGWQFLFERFKCIDDILDETDF